MNQNGCEMGMIFHEEYPLVNLFIGLFDRDKCIKHCFKKKYKVS